VHLRSSRGSRNAPSRWQQPHHLHAPGTAMNTARPPRQQRYVSIGDGVTLPDPEPGNAAATAIGKANVRKDTKPEIALRSELHRRGLRFRKDLPVRAEGRRVRPDVVFTAQLVAVFVDGCFWHGCPDHQHVPRRNRAYWEPKLQANAERDRAVDAALTAGGWLVVRPVPEMGDLADAAPADRRSRPPDLNATAVTVRRTPAWLSCAPADVGCPTSWRRGSSIRSR
jgi:DNA mismatch endonuclease (patch repair protein)